MTNRLDLRDLKEYSNIFNPTIFNLFKKEIKANYSEGKRIFDPKFSEKTLNIKEIKKGSFKVEREDTHGAHFYLSLIPELSAPFSDKVNEGILSVNLVESQLYNPKVELWESAREPKNIEYTRLIDRGLRAGVINFENLSIDEKNCIKLNIDIHVVKFSGELLDLIYYSLSKILKSYKLPKLVKINDAFKLIDEENILEEHNVITKDLTILKDICLCRTVYFSENYTYDYCSEVEVRSLNSGLFIVSDGNQKIKAIQKLGNIPVEENLLLNTIEESIKINLQTINKI